MASAGARLAIDVRGGDHGEEVILRGVLNAYMAQPGSFTARLCGDSDEILRILTALDVDPSLIGTVLVPDHCPEVIHQDDSPARVWKAKERSAVIRCIRLQNEGVVDASLSAEDTRVLMGAAVFILGRQSGISRPALAALLPTTGARPTLLLDVGANIDCKTENLIEFAGLGYDCYQSYFSVETPRVALLNIGKEPTKGTRTIREARDSLVRSCPGFAGFTEGSDILTGSVDVVVCDGFTGNAVLKVCESLHGLARKALGDGMGSWDTLQKRLHMLNSEKYGAAPLLGIHGIVLKAHGASSSQAIANAVLAAVRAVHTKASLPEGSREHTKGFSQVHAV